MSKELKEIVYSHNSVEFVTVAVQYCAYIESITDITQQELTDKLTKLLPFLYMKTSLVPDTAMTSEEEVEITVTEADYNYIMAKLYAIYGKDDTYLEVFMEDMKYSDTPISASIAEDLTDIYQDLKNAITIYERGITENMNDALYVCIENFKTYWGQKLVNVLRALHMLKYTVEDNLLEDVNIETDLLNDDAW